MAKLLEQTTKCPKYDLGASPAGSRALRPQRLLESVANARNHKAQLRWIHCLSEGKCMRQVELDLDCDMICRPHSVQELVRPMVV